VRIGKSILAFAVSPVIGALAFALALAAIEGAFPRFSFVLSAAIIAYVASAIVGVPLFLMTRPWGTKPAWFYILAAAVTAAAPVAIISVLFRSSLIPAAASVGAAVAGTFLWALSRWEPNNSLERTRER
jgi:hypothetical protein